MNVRVFLLAHVGIFKSLTNTHRPKEKKICKQQGQAGIMVEDKPARS